MAYDLSRVDLVYREYDVTATAADGNPATLDAVAVALLPPRTTPTAATTWTAGTYTGGVLTVLLAGPDASGAGALSVPAAGADLWVKVTDTPEIDAQRIERITVT